MNKKNFTSKIKLYDVTLREGSQAEGVYFSIKDKLKIIHLLDEIGMDYIEGGWPGTNPKDTDLYNIMKGEKLDNAVLVAFGMTRRVDNKVEDDPFLEALIKTEVEHVNIFAKGWDFHVREVLKITLEQNLELVYDSIQYLKRYIPNVSLGIEHFFDGYKANPEYIVRLIKVAEDAGAIWVGAVDTNGGCLPDEVYRILTETRKISKLVRAVHIHQDSGLAIAATMKAIECGADILHGTINGIGERCGITDFCTLIPNLQFKMGINCISGVQVKRLREIAYIVAECGGFDVYKYSPYVGESAFSHKGGIHVDAVLKNPMTYNHIVPEWVGNKYTTTVSELSGKANIFYWASRYGINIDKNDLRIVNLLNYIKKQERKGLRFDEADASRFILFKYFIDNYKPNIKVKDFSLSINKEWRGDLTHLEEEKEIIDMNIFLRLIINKEIEEISVICKTNPFMILSRIVKEIVGKYYKDLVDYIKIIGFKIQKSDYFYEHSDSQRVSLVLKAVDLSLNETYCTIGISYDIYSAFLKAFIDVFEYKILKNNGENKRSEV